MSDSWCGPVKAKSGFIVYGGAARNVRIAASGGMDEIILFASTIAAEEALKLADSKVRLSHRQLRLVK